MGKNKRDITAGRWPSAVLNNQTYLMYYNRLKELALNLFKWINLPDTIDERYLELTLYDQGQAVFFRDDVLGYLALQCAAGGKLNVYRVPTQREVITETEYHAHLNENDSVLIYNNYLRIAEAPAIEQYAYRLYEITRAIDVNIRQQKTPLVILSSEQQRLVMKNLYMQYDGNEPFIFGNKNIDLDSIKVLKTDAPYLCDKLNILKRQIWGEALTYLGIDNNSSEKAERMITTEVSNGLGAVRAARLTRLNARKQACEQINRMFGLDIDVEFREEMISPTERQQELEIIKTSDEILGGGDIE